MPLSKLTYHVHVGPFIDSLFCSIDFPECKPLHINYFSFILSLNIWCCDFFNCVLAQHLFFSFNILPSYINSRISLSKKSWRDFNWNCVKAIDQFREMSIWYLKHMESFKPRTCFISSLTRSTLVLLSAFYNVHYIDLAHILLDTFRAIVKGGPQESHPLVYLPYNLPTSEREYELWIWWDIHSYD